MIPDSTVWKTLTSYTQDSSPILHTHYLPLRRFLHMKHTQNTFSYMCCQHNVHDRLSGNAFPDISFPDGCNGSFKNPKSWGRYFQRLCFVCVFHPCLNWFFGPHVPCAVPALIYGTQEAHQPRCRRSIPMFSVKVCLFFFFFFYFIEMSLNASYRYQWPSDTRGTFKTQDVSSKYSINIFYAFYIYKNL